MANSNNPYDLWSGRRCCHPSAPAGGGGSGAFTSAGPTNYYIAGNDLPHPYSPAARHLIPEDIGGFKSWWENRTVKTKNVETALSWDEVKEDFEKWEGRFSFMYLDTKGFVTVGIGKMLPNVATAQKLGFVRRTDKSIATSTEIATDFTEVKKQPFGRLASSYEKHTKLDLPDKVIDDLLKIEVSNFEKSLESYFKDYKTYPTNAKRALLDMIYNLGLGVKATKSHHATGLHQFKILKAAVESGDWKKASENCHRVGPSEARNNWTRDRFIEAAKTK